jgi:hypothetical protein
VKAGVHVDDGHKVEPSGQIDDAPELTAMGRVGRERAVLVASYVHSCSRGELNEYNQFFGSFSYPLFAPPLAVQHQRAIPSARLQPYVNRNEMLQLDCEDRLIPARLSAKRLFLGKPEAFVTNLPGAT